MWFIFTIFLNQLKFSSIFLLVSDWLPEKLFSIMANESCRPEMVVK